jgi:hypothetical protein
MKEIDKIDLQPIGKSTATRRKLGNAGTEHTKPRRKKPIIAEQITDDR